MGWGNMGAAFCLGASSASGCIRVNTDGYRRVPFLHSEWYSTYGSLLGTLGLILMFSELNVSHPDGICGRSPPALTCSCRWESGGALWAQPAALKNLRHLLGGDRGEIFVFAYSKLAYTYISLYISCLIFIIPHTGLVFLLV